MRSAAKGYNCMIQLCVNNCSLLHSPGEEESDKRAIEISVNETINIFSIASGHLYERFLR